MRTARRQRRRAPIAACRRVPWRAGRSRDAKRGRASDAGCGRREESRNRAAPQSGGSACRCRQVQELRHAVRRRRRADRNRQIRCASTPGRTTKSITASSSRKRSAGARSRARSRCPDTKRLGQFADKHGMMVGYHGHTETGPKDWETAFSYAAHNGANLDIGHFVAGNHGSPISFLTEHHDRITHVHVKDRKATTARTSRSAKGIRRSRTCCACCAIASGRSRRRSSSNIRFRRGPTG